MKLIKGVRGVGDLTWCDSCLSSSRDPACGWGMISGGEMENAPLAVSREGKEKLPLEEEAFP